MFIDFGEQLPGADKKELSGIEGLTCGDVSKSALFITHYHGDHIGSISNVASDLSIYAGKTAIEIFNCFESRLSHIPDPSEAEKHKKIVERLKTIKIVEALQRIKIGGITVTPLFVDHSAFDAFMFIVEADGKRILHTGDFRGHGFKSKGFMKALKKYVKNIDYIISEGSNIQHLNVTMQTEQELQKNFETQFRKNKYNFVFVSSTNIDRIFALYHASERTKRCFICDNYQAKIMKIVSKNHKQYTPFYDIDYDQTTNPAGRFFDLKRRAQSPFSFIGNLEPYLERHGFCMLIRSNDVFKPLLDEYAKSEETKIYYSMWNGYLDKEKEAFNELLYNFFEPYNLEHKHTSGHADIETLNAVFETVNPACGIIPIHTEAPEKFQRLFKGQTVILLKDGEIFRV
ncbi:MAG: MBL fold metallo-hydrolase [Tannerella sp.]|nr:MBL fold metallo-hydrolase [Tannerella sp.]